jgi:hypothetical protein
VAHQAADGGAVIRKGAAPCAVTGLTVVNDRYPAQGPDDDRNGDDQGLIGASQGGRRVRSLPREGSGGPSGDDLRQEQFEVVFHVADARDPEAVNQHLHDIG